jgi:large subunit ribosomal protein L11
MLKKIKTVVKLILNAGKATPAPPIGPALGQHGINIASFCKEFNAKTNASAGFLIPVKIVVYEDKSFSFLLKSPTASSLLLKEANITKGSSFSSKLKVGDINFNQLKNVFYLKINDLNTVDIKKGCSILIGTAKSLGISVS